MHSKLWILWNLFLAAIPVGLGYAIAFGAKRLTIDRKRTPWWVWLLPGLVWFAFLPNTCYLLTEWRHFLFDPRFVSIREDAGGNSVVMLTVAKQGLFFFLYSGVGTLCFALSIRPIHRLLRRTRITLGLWAIPFFFLISLGVYMGLNPRLNSWDLLNRPAFVFQIALHAFTNLLLLKTIVEFAAILWALYVIVDMWVDGVNLRFRQAKETTAKMGA